LYPDVPTLKELGIDYSADVWRGMFLPGTAPEGSVDYWEDAFRQAYDTDSFQDWIANGGMQPGWMGPDEFRDFINGQSSVLGNLLEKYGNEIQ
jgi:tripartite-type tricarboxylate transporter receptor subunit TctC